jgi:death-on-curing protein
VIVQTFFFLSSSSTLTGLNSACHQRGYGLITNHPFVDGNKRIGTHAMLVTLDINGIELQYQDEDLIHLILKIASGKADDRILRTWVLAHIA